MSVPKGSTKARVPTALKLLKGSFNTTRANHREPTSPPKVPTAPAYLSATEKRNWAKFAAVLEPMRVATAEDFAALEMLVIAYTQWSTLQQALRDQEASGEDLTYDTQNKYGTMRRVKPELQAISDIEHRMLNLLGRFGLTPADRGRVSQADGDKHENKEDEFT